MGYLQVRKLAGAQNRKHKNLQVRKLASGETGTGRGNAEVRKVASCLTYKSGILRVMSKATILECLENEWIVVAERSQLEY